MRALQRNDLYGFPWSQVDNPGTWIEVTDICDLFCPGCFRHRLEGHRPLEVIKDEVLMCQRSTNCERVAIAGGEPLIYPHLLDNVGGIQCSADSTQAIDITSDEMFELVQRMNPDLRPCAFLNGTVDPSTNRIP
jgi:molybdenum cofactor biosynthesis enzyme MoaA